MQSQKPFTPFQSIATFDRHIRRTATVDVGQRIHAVPTFNPAALDRAWRYWEDTLTDRLDAGEEPFSSLNYTRTLGLICAALAGVKFVKFKLQNTFDNSISAPLRACLSRYPSQYLALYVTLAELQVCDREFEGAQFAETSFREVNSRRFCEACEGLAADPRTGFDFLQYF